MQKNPNLKKLHRAGSKLVDVAFGIGTVGIIIGIPVSVAFGIVFTVETLRGNEAEKTKKLNDVLEYAEDGAVASLSGDNAISMIYNGDVRITIDLDDRFIVGGPSLVQPFSEANNALVERAIAMGCRITHQMDNDLPLLSDDIKSDNAPLIEEAQKRSALFKKAHCATIAP